MTTLRLPVILCIALAAVLLTVSASAVQDEAAGGAPAISDALQECFIDVPYPLVDASIRPAEKVQVAKVYFRALQGSAFYAVEMKRGETGYVAVLPAPSSETEYVVYYVEAVTPTFDSGRTEEFTVEVVDEEECDEARFLGSEPGIVVYSVVEGAPAIPTGFLSTGVTATVTAGGVTTAVGGGGLGAGVIGGIVAGAAGGVIIRDGIDDDEPEPVASPVNPP